MPNGAYRPILAQEGANAGCSCPTRYLEGRQRRGLGLPGARSAAPWVCPRTTVNLRDFPPDRARNGHSLSLRLTLVRFPATPHDQLPPQPTHLFVAIISESKRPAGSKVVAA